MFDLVTGPESSSPTELTALGTSLLLFTARTPPTGTELFKFDVSTGLVTLVEDLTPGIFGTELTSFAACNGRVFFNADIPNTLFATDGSAVDNLGTISSFGEPRRGICVGTQLLFPDGSTLHKSDGTAAGTSVVDASFAALEFALLGDKVFMHDGGRLASIGTDLLGSLLIVDTPGLIQFQTLATFGSPARLFFGASDGITGVEPYVSDGTDGGATLLAAVPLASVRPVVVGASIFFVTGSQLFESDSPAAAVSLHTFASTPAVLAAAGTKVIVREDSATDSLHVLDTTNDMVTTLCNAPTVNAPTLSAAAGRVYFLAQSPTTTFEEFWVTDGSAGCTQLKDLIDVSFNTASPQVRGLAALGSTVLFHAATTALGRELYRTAPPFSSIELVKDIFLGSGGSMFSNERLVVMGSRVYFTANDGVNGVELWTSDGTEDGTQLVADLSTTGSSSPQFLTAIGTTLLFSADAGAGLGRELYSFVEGGSITLVRDISPGVGASSNPSGFTAVGAQIFLFATTGAGRQLYVLQGVNTVSLVGTASGVRVATSTTIAVLGNLLFFPATEPTLINFELAILNGDTGQFFFEELNPGSSSSSPTNFVVSGSSVFFFAATALEGRELWRSQGPGTTDIVQDLLLGSVSGISDTTAMLVAFNGGVLVAAQTAFDDQELYFATAGSITLVKDIEPGGPSRPQLVAVDGAVAYLAATTSATGTELWRTDGTAAGTVLVEDIRPGTFPSSPARGIVVSGITLFTARDQRGEELFKITHVCDTAEAATTCAAGTYGIAIAGGGQACIEFNGGDQLASDLDASEIGPCDVVVTGGGVDSA
ncbi:MAG: hypothetical protein IV100_30725, partial [Myxococcales bacterium]|nr:hypothetical protein [Myxococcales bacterium]